ncbi:hypothetical protein E3N88_12665 [Mikania micrantha]|uniref:Autophagy-related protein 13 N-terminal domain-containing protein n=1 Tax=Mikania micrantha TaxID=192012 RepID=A0A5N6P958_9ASTR|nr:hypothetical protein E3N88_12665 [Mikania micrantha]
MDFQYNNPNEHGRNDQIVSQFLLKSLHIVLESRVPSIRSNGRGGSLSSGGQVKKSDKWFNLALGERLTPLDCLSFWHRNLMEPMIIDIVLVQDMPDLGQNGSGYGTLVETVIERWVVQYEYSRTPPSHQLSESYKKTYKKSIILLRSLYTMMRLLPAYRAYRKLSSKGRDCGFDIVYKVSSFSAPFSRSEEQMMKLYTFVPVEAQHGHLSISVRYRESLSDFNLETSASFPPEIIIDYVGSPATDPFRAFPDNKAATSFPNRETSRLQRPHSWSSGGLFTHNQGPPVAHHSSSGRYDLSSSPTSYDVYGQRTQNYRPPTHHSFDDSPPFSPSPPTYHSNGGNYMHSRLRSETAPVSIPNPLTTTTPRYLSPNLSDPNRHSLPPLSPRSTRYELSSHESPSAIRSLKKSEMSRVGDLSSASGSGSANHYSPTHKVSRDNKDDSGRFSGLLSSSGSPRIGFSRSSSRLSLQDELDDIEFSCPFIVDDVDTCDSPVSHSGIGGKQGKKSQDAAVGALVRMLRTAPPLRQDSSCCSDHVEAQSNASGLFMSRMTSDALEELKAYTDIKHLILSKSKDAKQQHLYTL